MRNLLSPEKVRIDPSGSATVPAAERHSVLMRSWYDGRLDQSSKGSSWAMTRNPRSV